MNNRILAMLGGSLTLALLIACGDGGGGKSDSGSGNSTVKTPSVSLATPGGTPCASSFGNSDAFGNSQFQYSTGTTPWGCLVVNQADNQPTVSGINSVRIEVRPGDCDSSQTFLSGTAVVSDCTSDRSRYEIHQRASGSTSGQIITYEYYVYIPAQANFQPPWSKTGSTPLTVLTQINWQCGAIACPSLGSNGYGSLAYLTIDNSGTLFFQTQQDFSWVPNGKVAIDTSPFDKWIKVKFVIKSSSSGDGYIQAYANDRLLINEARATIPNIYAYNTLKLGVYNSSISTVSKPWSTQVIYFDAFSTAVQNF